MAKDTLTSEEIQKQYEKLNYTFKPNAGEKYFDPSKHVYQSPTHPGYTLNSEEKIEIPDILGLPPESNYTGHVIRTTMPILEIQPCISQFKIGVEVFKLKPVWDQYQDLLDSLNYTVPSEPKYLRTAFLADSFPTDTFSNEYGESFLNKITNVVSQGAGDLAQFFGATSGGEAAKGFTRALGQIGKGMGPGSTIGGAISEMSDVGVGAISKAQRALRRMQSSGGLTGSAAGIAAMTSRMLTGARVDFPQVWKNSGFTPSYSVTIRLYNPNPSDPMATRKYIVGPLAALLLLAVPHSIKGETYSWPYLHKIKCRGLFSLDTAFISNVVVVKGGDQHQIAWNQCMAMADVRIDFGSVYNSMLVMEDTDMSVDRPTLRSYIKALTPDDQERKKVIMHGPTDGIKLSFIEDEKLRLENAQKKKSKSISSAPEDISLTDRVSSGSVAIKDTLKGRIVSGSGFNIS